MEGYKPGDECRRCGGQCCKSKGCSLAPEDMLRVMQEAGYTEVNEDSLYAFLSQAENLYAIDRFSGAEGMVYFLRMRHKCFTFVGVDAFGECIALGANGCQLSFEERPKGGRFLESRPDRRCVERYDGQQMEEDWKPYTACLRAVFQKYDAIFEADGTYDRCEEENRKRVMGMR